MHMEHLSTSERSIIRKLVKAALEAGYNVTVSDEEDRLIQKSRQLNDILAQIGHSSENLLTLRNADDEKIGFVYLVYGNEPGVVISDHSDTDTMNAFLAPIHKYANTFDI